MKKTFAATLAFTAALLLSSTAVLAKPFRVELDSSTLIREVSMTEGTAVVNLDKAVVNIVVRHLPENPLTGEYEGVELTDRSTRPATVKEAEGYAAWLLRVQFLNGKYIITDGYALGILEVGRNGTARLKYKGYEDLSSRGFNVIAVTAEEDYTVQHWIPGDEFIQAMRWDGSPNGVIVLWNAFSPL